MVWCSSQGQAGDEEEVLFEADDVNYVNGQHLRLVGNRASLLTSH